MVNVALKEWSVVCDLLLDGELAILLRKGGVHEEAGPGRFEIAHQRFVFFPAWEHQMPQLIKPAYRSRVEVFDREPSIITMNGLGEVEPETIWQVPGRAAFDRLEDLHCWTSDQIDMRFSYKPQRPLYLLAVRAYRLAEPKTVQNDPNYAGCKSWVPLRSGHEVDDRGAVPVLADSAFNAILKRIKDAIA